MLTVPSFQEDPAALVPILKAYCEVRGPSPAEVIRREEAERRRSTIEVLQRLGRSRASTRIPFLSRALVVRTLLAWTQASIGFRERVRLKQALLYTRCRQLVLAIGSGMTAAGLLDRPEDVFFLTWDEVQRLGSGCEMFAGGTREWVALRKRLHADLGQIALGDTLRLEEGEHVSAGGPADAGGGRPRVSSPPVQLRGVGACGGKATGRVNVVTEVSGCHQLARGDVLVTRQTDPGWAPAFFLLNGLVVERGGLLSHGAIVAREFGVPAVVGVPDAAQLLAQAHVVEVDGDHGLVNVAG